MWWGVILGLAGLGIGFFGLHRAAAIEGRIEEGERQKRHADMIRQEMLKKDIVIDKKTGAKTQLIRRTTRLRRKTKSMEAVNALLSRVKQPW